MIGYVLAATSVALTLLAGVAWRTCGAAAPMAKVGCKLIAICGRTLLRPMLIGVLAPIACAALVLLGAAVLLPTGRLEFNEWSFARVTYGGSLRASFGFYCVAVM